MLSIIAIKLHPDKIEIVKKKLGGLVVFNSMRKNKKTNMYVIPIQEKTIIITQKVTILPALDVCVYTLVLIAARTEVNYLKKIQ